MTRSAQSPFDILGVKPSDDHAAIRKAWKRLVKQHHPDRSPLHPDVTTARLAELNAAYDKLRNHVPIRPTQASNAQTAPQDDAPKSHKSQHHTWANSAAEARARREARNQRATPKDPQPQRPEPPQSEPTPDLTPAQAAALRRATRGFAVLRSAADRRAPRISRAA